MQALLSRDLYEITSEKTPLQNVMLRWRIRKLCLINLKQNVLVENVEWDDKENTVRFAVLHKENVEEIQDYIYSILSDAKVTLIKENIQNPILSKLKTNMEERYTL
jgi:hypothetical protein